MLVMLLACDVVLFGDVIIQMWVPVAQNVADLINEPLGVKDDEVPQHLG